VRAAAPAVYSLTRTADARRAFVQTKTQEVARRRFTVDEYHRMAEAGILHEDDRIELIEGELSEMTPIGARHANSVRNFNRLLSRQASGEFLVDVQSPVRLDERNEPQPDLAVIRARDYRRSLPTPEDVLLVVEVSDTTLAYDREVKLPLYARAGIPEVWVVDLTGETVERHTEPSGDGYRRTERARRGEEIRSASLPGLSLRADDVL
jgi:Uma2 family endonuclease